MTDLTRIRATPAAGVVGKDDLTFIASAGGDVVSHLKFGDAAVLTGKVLGITPENVGGTTQPTTALFPTAFHGRGATVDVIAADDPKAGLILTPPVTDVTGVYGRSRAIPGAAAGHAFTFAARLEAMFSGKTNSLAGIVFGDTAGNFFFFGPARIGGVDVFYVASWVGGVFSDVSYQLIADNRAEWKRIAIDASGNIRLYISQNGTVWAPLQYLNDINDQTLTHHGLGYPSFYGMAAGRYNNAQPVMSVPEFFSDEFPAVNPTIGLSLQNVVPQLASFSDVVNAAITDASTVVFANSANGGIGITQPDRGANDFTAEFQMPFVPAGNFDIKAYVEVDGLIAGYDTCGIAIYDASGKRKCWGIGGHGSGTVLRNQNWADINTFAGEAYTDPYLPFFGPACWVRLKYDGTNFLFQLSKTGETWTTFYTESPTLYLTGPPVKLALGLTVNNSKGKAGYFRKLILSGV